MAAITVHQKVRFPDPRTNLVADYLKQLAFKACRRIWPTKWAKVALHSTMLHLP
jgi:hypothetical protein